MTVAFDVDGVITEAPAFFAVVTQALRAAGHRVLLITDFAEHFREQRVRELAGYGVEYDALVITGSKARRCREEGVDVMVDDEPEVYFPDCDSTRVSIITLSREHGG